MTVISQIIPERQELSQRALIEALETAVANPRVFDEEVISFLSDLSTAILRDRDLQRIPEVAAFAFWIRRASVQKMITDHGYLLSGENYRVHPIGRVFHICPSNVDTMFLYSIVVSLLMGNSNVVRVSSRLNESYINLIFDLINDILNSKYARLKQLIRVLTYERNDEINASISLRSEARIIWGGDETIRSFKRIESHVRCKDLVFADRESMALINAAAWSDADPESRELLIRNLYNDTYSFDQKGCSCPQRLFLLGTAEQCGKAEGELYQLLLGKARLQYENDVASLVSLKWSAMADDAIEGRISGVKNEGTELIFADADINMPSAETCGAGYLYISYIADIQTLKAVISKRTQTLSHWGFTVAEIEQIEQLIAGNGVDRMVPVGKALEFGYVWDGYDLMDELCSKRKVVF